jgi:hypothetical protein
MMMTSGAAVKYNSSMHCMSEIVKNEGVKSLFKVSTPLSSDGSHFDCGWKLRAVSTASDQQQGRGGKVQVMVTCSKGTAPAAAGSRGNAVMKQGLLAVATGAHAASSQDTQPDLAALDAMQGAGANILRAVAGAGVLSGYDQLQLIVFGKKFGGGDGGCMPVHRDSHSCLGC